MTKPNESAFPYQDTHPMAESYTMRNSEEGLTKREYFALHLMQGMLANSNIGCSSRDLASEAVGAADLLIEQLNRQ